MISFSQSCWKKCSLKGEIQIRACWIISSTALSLCAIDRNQNNSFDEILRLRLDLGAWSRVLPLKSEFDKSVIFFKEIERNFECDLNVKKATPALRSHQSVAAPLLIALIGLKYDRWKCRWGLSSPTH